MDLDISKLSGNIIAVKNFAIHSLCFSFLQYSSIKIQYKIYFSHAKVLLFLFADLVQDAASKGLGVVYECCSEATRQSMVEGLVQTLTEGKRSIQNVTDDTKIFQEGELGKAPSG